MTGFLILVTVLLFVLLLLWLLKNKIREYKFSPLIFAGSLLFSLLALVFFVETLATIQKGFERKKWPSTTGVVYRSEVHGVRAYHPKIFIRYHLNNAIYNLVTDLNVSGFGSKRSRRDTAERIIEAYPVGYKVLVYYNPAKPEQSFLRTGPFWQDYLKITVGTIVLACGLFGILSGILQRSISSAIIVFSYYL